MFAFLLLFSAYHVCSSFAILISVVCVLAKLVPVGYGIKKLQVMLTIVDDLVSVDTLIEEHLTVEPINEYVQSCDIVAFNKICKYFLSGFFFLLGNSLMVLYSVMHIVYGFAACSNAIWQPLLQKIYNRGT